MPNLGTEFSSGAEGSVGRLRIDGSSLCADSGGANPSPGQQLALAKCSGSDQWVGDGSYGSLVMNGLCFAPENWELGSGAPVILFNCVPTQMDQQWQFRAGSTIGSELLPDLCITAKAVSEKSVLVLDTCTGAQRQLWQRD